MGLTGIELGCNILGKSLGEPQFLGFFHGGGAPGRAVFVHALHPTFASTHPWRRMNAIGFPTDTGLTIASLIGGGTAEKAPNLRIAFSHGGGTFPFMLPRYTHGWGGTWNEAPGSRGMGADSLPRSPAEYARRFYYDTLLFDARAIRYLIDIIGAVAAAGRHATTPTWSASSPSARRWRAWTCRGRRWTRSPGTTASASWV